MAWRADVQRPPVVPSICLLGGKWLKAPSVLKVLAQSVGGEGEMANTDPQVLIALEYRQFLPAGPLSLPPSCYFLFC